MCNLIVKDPPMNNRNRPRRFKSGLLSVGLSGLLPKNVSVIANSSTKVLVRAGQKYDD
jgi:hypothetical protein